jgi:signal transduction histidine kinase
MWRRHRLGRRPRFQPRHLTVKPARPKPRRLDPRQLDLALAILLTVAAEAQILAGATATGLVLAPALAAPALTLPVAVRRLHPAAVAVWAMALATAQIAIWGDPQVVGVTIAYLCALYGLAVWTGTRTFAAAVALMILVGLPVAGLGPDTDFSSAALFAIVAVIAMLIARRAITGREQRARLAEREREVLAREAVVEERARIARELHGAIAHNISMVVMQAGAERRAIEKGAGSPHDVLETIEQVGRTAMTEMRRLVGMLRSESDDPLAPQPGLADLATLAGRLNAGGAAVELHLEGEPRALPVGIELAAYRIVEEALAGGQARVSVRYGRDRLELEVRENGSPALDDDRGSRLLAIRERVALYGGRLDHDDLGVRVVLPVR